MCQNIDQAQNDGFTEHILVKDALRGHIVTGLVNIGVMPDCDGVFSLFNLPGIREST